MTWYKRLARSLYRVKIALTRYFVLRVIKLAAGLVILASIFHEAYEWKLRALLIQNNIGVSVPDAIQTWLSANGILIITESFWLKALLLIILLLFFPSGKNLLLFLLRQTSGFFRKLPGKQTTEMIRRYINMPGTAGSRIFLQNLPASTPQGAV